MYIDLIKKNHVCLCFICLIKCYFSCCFLSKCKMQKDENDRHVFIVVDTLLPSQQFFSHVRMISCLPGLKQY